jgi:predicted dienelactone hydrolase
MAAGVFNADGTDHIDPLRRRVVASATWVASAMGLNATVLGQTLGTTTNGLNVDPDMLVLIDPKTKRRIKLRTRLPDGSGKAGLILYSPGLGSGISNGAAWCEAWRQAGFVVVTLAHPVTDDSLWTISPGKSFKTNVSDAIAGPQYGLRVADCRFVIDYCLEKAEFAPRLDAGRIGLAGHSFGALTAQSIAGQSGGAQSLRDARVRAVIALSPTAISAERAQALKSVDIPFFSVTGTHDQYVTFKKGGEAVRLGVSLAQRELVYEHLPAGEKIQLKLNLADHMSFAGEAVDTQSFSRDVSVTSETNAQIWERVSMTTSLFWRFYLDGPKLSGIQTRQELEQQMRQLIGPSDELKFG